MTRRFVESAHRHSSERLTQTHSFQSTARYRSRFSQTDPEALASSSTSFHLREYPTPALPLFSQPKNDFWLCWDAARAAGAVMRLAVTTGLCHHGAHPSGTQCWPATRTSISRCHPYGTRCTSSSRESWTLQG